MCQRQRGGEQFQPRILHWTLVDAAYFYTGNHGLEKGYRGGSSRRGRGAHSTRSIPSSSSPSQC